jgi:hypothetical protein
VFTFERDRAAEADVESREPLLSIQNRYDFSVRNRAMFRTMATTPLVIVTNEIVEFPIPNTLRADLPKEESTKREAPHQAVEEAGDLVWPPYEFALDRGKDPVFFAQSR